MIRIDSLRAFIVVAETGTLREAADQLNRTQSALSMTLKQLEAELGGSLFETDRKRDLTDLGHYVRQVALDIVRDHDHGIDLIKRYAKGKSGRLRLVSVPSVAALILPDLLQTFLDTQKDAEIDLVDTDSAAVRKAVASGRADLGIASPGAGLDGIETEFLFSDELYAVCRKDCTLAQCRGPLEWGQLQDFPLIMNETLFQLESIEFRRLASHSRLSARNILSLLAMVRAGAGITILPGLATVSLDPELVALPLADPACLRNVCLLSRSGRAPSPIAQAMRLHLRNSLPLLAGRYGFITGQENGKAV